ncbi:type VII secretion target [Mycobacterium sp. NPDC050853]|uniref:type VII secretion target n=1 Tax=Mycobacteriaceae TaxID=1762 RepID=UPI0015DEAFEF|nr:ESX-1 secretion-associated protein [Mycobacteroides sp. LB1]
MGETSIDVPGVRGVAGEFDNLAGELQKAIEQLRGLSFAGASAGRWHTAKGDQVSAGLREVVTHLEDWHRTNTAIAEQLRVTAQRYADLEAKNKARMAAADGR